jgi:hypothetical protein
VGRIEVRTVPTLSCPDVAGFVKTALLFQIEDVAPQNPAKQELVQEKVRP